MQEEVQLREQDWCTQFIEASARELQRDARQQYGRFFFVRGARCAAALAAPPARLPACPSCSHGLIAKTRQRAGTAQQDRLQD